MTKLFIKRAILPQWIIQWLIISTLIIGWDVMFIFLRPYSFPGGKLAAIWLPYATYIKIDTSYADMTNDFVMAQALMSVFETGIGIIALYLNYRSKASLAILFAFSALLLTGTKTILIFILEVVSGLKHVGHNSMLDLILYYVLPNSIWIIIPFLGVFILGHSLICDSIDRC